MPDQIPSWLAAARRNIGQAEVPGSKHNPLILRWWKAIRAPFVDDETPWCAAFVGGLLEEQGIQSSRAASARSYLQWGQPLVMPALGAVAVFARPPSPWTGHVGFVNGVTPEGNLLILGGNQGNRVRVDPFSEDRLLGLRWPLGVPLPDPALLPVAAGGALSTNEV